jgi:formylglycine-generating enzyme required for sulfatase activity
MPRPFITHGASSGRDRKDQAPPSAPRSSVQIGGRRSFDSGIPESLIAPAPLADDTDPFLCSVCGEEVQTDELYCDSCGSHVVRASGPQRPVFSPDRPNRVAERPEYSLSGTAPLLPVTGYDGDPHEPASPARAGSLPQPTLVTASEAKFLVYTPPETTVVGESAPFLAAPDARADAGRRAVSPFQRPDRRLLVGSLLVLGLVGSVMLWLAPSTPDSGAVRETPSTGGAIRELPNPAPPEGMVFVPGTEFVMGNDAGDAYEYPQHNVKVGPFFIDMHEVTCEEYQRFVDATGHKPPPAWREGIFPSGWARRPVTDVTWDDASAYAAWAGKRLPTETEWELAARGADGRRYPWGAQWRPGLANAGPLAGKGVIELKVSRGGCWASTETQATTTFRRGWPARRTKSFITYQDTGFRCAADVGAG